MGKFFVPVPNGWEVQIMHKSMRVFDQLLLIAVIFQMGLTGCLHAAKPKVFLSCSGPVIIDHTCTKLSRVPDQWIDSAQSDIKWYYAHTSHGGQLTIGLERIEKEDSRYDMAIDRGWLPREAGAVCILDNPHVGPDNYWKTAGGRKKTQDVIDYNPINLSMWSWCGQMGVYTKGETQRYLDVMADFEDAHPEVVFVYMTGHAQHGGNKGHNRHLRNNQILRWVGDHPEKNRVLFDFADLDSWSYDPDTGGWEQATYEHWNGNQYVNVPIEHARYHGNEKAHTTFESCEQKSKAVWWMLARLAGWQQ